MDPQGAPKLNSSGPVPRPVDPPTSGAAAQPVTPIAAPSQAGEVVLPYSQAEAGASAPPSAKPYQIFPPSLQIAPNVLTSADVPSDTPKTAAEIAAAHDIFAGRPPTDPGGPQALSPPAAVSFIPPMSTGGPVAAESPTVLSVPTPPLPVVHSTGLNRDPDNRSGKTKMILGAIFLLAIFLGAGYYLLIMPSAYAAAYHRRSQVSKGKAAAEVKKAVEVFSLPSFSSSTSTVEGDTSDLTGAINDIAAAKKAVETMKPELQKYAILPGWILSPAITSAKKEHDKNIEYLGAVSTYLDSISSLVDYNLQLLPLQSRLGDTMTAVLAINTQTDPQAADKLSVFAAQINSVMGGVRGIKPPKDLLANHTEVIQDYTAIATLLRHESAALKSRDSASATLSTSQLTIALLRISSEQANFIDKLQHKSDTSSEIERVKSLQ